jgi:hypothetical protein
LSVSLQIPIDLPSNLTNYVQKRKYKRKFACDRKFMRVYNRILTKMSIDKIFQQLNRLPVPEVKIVSQNIPCKNDISVRTIPLQEGSR